VVDRVPASEIETLVGIDRHPVRHYGRADSRAGKFFILHSDECRRAPESITQCEYSLALERGLNEADWYFYEDCPVVLGFDEHDNLVPYAARRRASHF
jgi:hypothetical protein